MTNLFITDFQTNYPELTHLIQRTEGDNCKWGRLICRFTSSDKKIENIYAATINLENGDVYLDCSKKKIFAKCCVLAAIYPIHTMIKTIYHLCLPISLPLEIYKAVQEGKKGDMENKQLARHVFKRIGRNLLDCGRTPLYGLAFTIITLSGVLIGPFAPKQLYTIREIAGKIELALNWNNEDSDWNLAPCFCPLLQLKKEIADIKIIDTVRKHNKIRFIVNTFGESQVYFRQHNRMLFNDCYRLLPINEQYISPDISPDISPAFLESSNQSTTLLA